MPVHMPMRVGVIGHQGYDGVARLLHSIREIITTLGGTVYYEPSLRELVDDGASLESQEHVDLIVSLGGDGTMLRAARFTAGTDIPILGINLGRLGFMTSCGVEDIDAALHAVMRGEYEADIRMAIEATVVGTDGAVKHTWQALNDFVLHKGGVARMLGVRAVVNGELMSAYTADGIIVSTPTGSTAYSLSAGGPVVVPAVHSILVTPISPHALAIRPVVLPADAEVMLDVFDGPDEILVTVDGQVGAELASGDKLIVRKASHPVRIVRFPGTTFYDRLRTKLGWGGLPARDVIS